MPAKTSGYLRFCKKHMAKAIAEKKKKGKLVRQF